MILCILADTAMLTGIDGDCNMLIYMTQRYLIDADLIPRIGCVMVIDCYRIATILKQALR